MADTVDYLDILEQGVEQWNRWREENPEILPDLSRAYLFEATLSGANLSGVNLNRACLIGANLKTANLCEANLQNSYVSKANLEGANLSNADLRQANLSEACLSQINLSNARIERTNLSAADLTGACIENWHVDVGTDFSDTKCGYLYQKQPQQGRYPESGSLSPETFELLLQRYRSSQTSALEETPPLPPKVVNSRSVSEALLTSPATAPRSSLTLTSRPTPKNLPPPPPELSSIKPLTLSRYDVLSQKRLLVASIGLVGLVIVGRTIIGFYPQLFASREPDTDSVPLIDGAAVNLTSLPCNELPPPDLKKQQPSYVYSSGVEFYGKFEGGIPLDGRGIMVFTNGDRYDGEFQAGLRNGCGTFTFANGRQYMGQFEDDQFHGIGIWQLETGERYVGQFQSSKCEGWGTFLFPDGSSKSGTWQDGALAGDALSCNRGLASEPEKTAP